MWNRSLMLWRGVEDAEKKPISFGGWIRVGLRLIGLAVVIFGLMGPMVLFRWIGWSRASQTLVQVACKISLRIVGIDVTLKGKAMDAPGAVVANHCSWLDIFTLNAVQKVLFVSKSDVAKWPVIGLVSRSTGTVFIERRASQAGAQRDIFLQHLNEGDRLLFFPEGTSTDGLQVLPFRSSLFAAFFEEGLVNIAFVQPMSLSYFAPLGESKRFYGWWGDMEFANHFLSILACAKHGSIEVEFHAPIAVRDVADRKELALRCEQAVRAGLRVEP